MITPFASYPPSDAPEFIKYSHHLIDLALRKARRPAILCSYGKDSGVVLHLLSQHVDLSRIDVIYIDSIFEFPAFYKHIAGMKAFFGIRHGGPHDVRCQNNQAIRSGMSYDNTPVLKLTQTLKTDVLVQVLKERNIDFLFTGIRRDEEGSRAKERYFSYREADGTFDPVSNRPGFYPLDGLDVQSPGSGHYRVNILLSWSERDVWEYTEKHLLPVCPLYLAKNGKRYRSLGDEPVTTPVDSDADSIDKIIKELYHTSVPERACRKSQDNSAPYAMEMLRRKGFC